MSELIAEARILVTPDTTTFRQLLIAETATAARAAAVTVPIIPLFTGGSGLAAATSASAAQAELAAATTAATGALRLEEILLAEGAVDMSRFAVATTAAAEANAGFAASARAASASTNPLTNSLGGLGKGAGSAAASMLGVRGATLAATGPFLAGAAGAIALGKSLSLATSFNSDIAVLGAVTEATGAQLSRAADAAREFGADITLPGVTAGDAARTITEFSKAGLDLEDSIAATRGGLQLAQAANIEYADAVTLAANALNAFNLEGDQAVHVADVLANAANLAQGGIEDTALALRQAAAAAEVVGVSFEDTSALLTLLARNGLTGSDAGTSLRTAFLRLVNPSKEANAIIEQLGINLRDMQGNVRPEVFADFAAAQADLSVKTQQANAAIVFGQDAFRAFGILGKEGAQGLQEVQVGLEKTGTAAEIARARMVGLAGAQENLSNQLDTLGLTIGQATTPFITSLVSGLGNAVKGLNLATDALRGLGGEKLDIDTAPLEDLRDRLVEITEEADHFRESGGFTPDRLKNEADEIVAQIERIGKALLASPSGLSGFVDLFSRSSPEIRKALEDGIITPAEEAAIAVTRLGTTFLELAPGQLFSGGFSQLEADAKKLVDAFGQIGEDVANSFFSFFEITARRAGKQVGATLKEVTVDVASRLGLDLALAQAAGDEGAELSVLRDQERRQKAFLEAVLQREKTEKNVALATEAAENLDRTRSRITAIVEGNAAEAKRDRDEQLRVAKTAQEEADKAFLQQQQDARTRQERSVTIAEDTTGLKDDIREQKELRTLITQQIAEIKASSLSEEAKQQAIRALRAQRQKTTDEIRDLRETNKELREQQKQEAQEQRASQLEFITDVAQLRGDIDAQAKGLQAEIVFWRKVALNAKKGSEAQREAILTVERKKKELRDLLDQEENLSGGKSLAEFLTENQNLFNQVASSGGISGVDPLTGFDFSASIVAKTKALQDAAAAAGVTTTRSDAKIPAADPQIDRLIAALEANTAATEGNTGTGGNGFNAQYQARVSGARYNAAADFWQARQARIMEQARFDGGGGV